MFLYGLPTRHIFFIGNYVTKVKRGEDDYDGMGLGVDKDCFCDEIIIFNPPPWFGYYSMALTARDPLYVPTSPWQEILPVIIPWQEILPVIIPSQEILPGITVA